MSYGIVPCSIKYGVARKTKCRSSGSSRKKERRTMQTLSLSSGIIHCMLQS